MPGAAIKRLNTIFDDENAAASYAFLCGNDSHYQVSVDSCANICRSRSRLSARFFYISVRPASNGGPLRCGLDIAARWLPWPRSARFSPAPWVARTSGISGSLSVSFSRRKWLASWRFRSSVRFGNPPVRWIPGDEARCHKRESHRPLDRQNDCGRDMRFPAGHCLERTARALRPGFERRSEQNGGRDAAGSARVDWRIRVGLCVSYRPARVDQAWRRQRSSPRRVRGVQVTHVRHLCAPISFASTRPSTPGPV